MESKIRMSERLDEEGMIAYRKWLVTPTTGAQQIRVAEREHGTRIWAPRAVSWIYGYT